MHGWQVLSSKPKHRNRQRKVSTHTLMYKCCTIFDNAAAKLLGLMHKTGRVAVAALGCCATLCTRQQHEANRQKQCHPRRGSIARLTYFCSLTICFMLLIPKSCAVAARHSLWASSNACLRASGTCPVAVSRTAQRKRRGSCMKHFIPPGISP